jgi:two-component system sensor kinase FixL
VLACRNITVEQCPKTVTGDAKGLGAIALEQGAPVAVLDALKDPRTRYRSFFRDNGLVSYVGLPLIAKGEALGVIGIFTKEKHEFSRDEIEFLSAVASHGAAAIHNSQLYREAETAKNKEAAVNRQLSELLKQITGLYSALAPLDASESPQQMLDDIIDRVLAATGADAASVRVLDEATQCFLHLAHRGLPQNYLEATRTGHRGKARATYQTGEALFIADIATDPRVGQKKQLTAGFRSCAYLPFRSKGAVKGVLHLASRSVGFFSEEKRAHLAALSRLLEIVFENRELFDEVIAAKESLEAANERHRMRAIQQAVLNHFSHLALSSKTIPSLLDEAVLHISQVLRVDYCAALELLPGGAGLVLRAGAGWKKDLVGRATVSSQWDSEAGYTLLSNEPVIISDLDRESRFTPSHLLREHGVVSGVAVTIEGQERPFGVIAAYTTSRRNFTDEEIHFLLSFAYVLATAVDRAQAEDKIRESQHKYEGLVESIDGIVWEADAETLHCTFVSRQGERILGYPLEQWLQEPNFWLAHLHPDDREWAPHYVKKKTKEMRPYELEFRMIAADGKVVWLRALVAVIADQGRAAMLRGICVDITEHKRMEMEVSEISERERQKIGQDLHDELGQLLTGIACIGAGLTQRLEAKAAPEAATAGQITTLTNQAIHQTRALARGLYPVELQTNGLASALKELAAAAEGMFGISCRLECDPRLSVPEDDVAIHLYRIAQEAIDNAVRHGKARHVRIGVENQSGRGILSVVDDGVGFSKAPPGYKGMGLRIMKTRAELIKGGLEVRKGESGGTIVECSFRRPLEGDHPTHA